MGGVILQGLRGGEFVVVRVAVFEQGEGRGGDVRLGGEGAEVGGFHVSLPHTCPGGGDSASKHAHEIGENPSCQKRQFHIPGSTATHVGW